MSSDKTPKQNPQRYEEAAKPEPEATPHVPEDEKGDQSSRLDESKEPKEDEEKKRVAKKLREREQNG